MEEPLTPNEKKLLQSHAHTDKVPHYLLTQITSTMKNEHLIQAPPSLISRSIPGLLTALLFSICLLTVGYFVGSKKSASPQTVQATANPSALKFILLVHNDDRPAEDPMQQVNEYSAWLTNIKAQRMAGGEHLQPKGWVLTHNSESKNIHVAIHEDFQGRNEVGGYFTFEATSQDEAVAIARTCPHLKYDGTLELRQIYPN